MNCKPGDDVIVVRSQFGNEGKIGKVIEAVAEKKGERFVLDGVGFKRGSDKPSWVVECTTASGFNSRRRTGLRVYVFADYRLRPLPKLRDDEQVIREVAAPTQPEIV